MRYKTGNLLDANTDALVNTVNTVGVMGKGIALQFKERYPYNYKVYAAACKAGEVKVGKMLVVKDRDFNGEKWIINFPTKTEWFKKSQYNYIEEGLQDLIAVIKTHNIKSIAIPPLGSGNGGLKWQNVKKIMDQYLGHLKDVEIIVYEPNALVKEILQKQEQKDVELKPGRAMLLYALFKYERLGEIASVFVANKLAYFLQQCGEKLRLEFVPYTYGPYTQAIDKVLYRLNGKYLTGLEQMQAKAFEPINLNYEKYSEIEDYINKNLSFEQHQRLKNLFALIDGFESPLSLEILASVHYLLSKDSKLSSEQILEKIAAWSERKKLLIDKEHVEIALKRLNEHSNTLAFN